MAKSIPVTDYEDISKVRTNVRQHRDPAQSKLKPIHALDAETHSSGDIFLIADSDGKYLDKISIRSAINFLFSKKYQDSWNFFYNLGYDAEVFLKLLGPELEIYKNTRELIFNYNKYKITYIPEKCLRISKGNHGVSFYDIAQFYNKSSLSNAYEKNIGELDFKYLEMKDKRQEFSPRYYNRNKRKMQSYCIKDCILTKELSEKWINLCNDAFGFYPAKWFSSGYLAEKVLINNGMFFPKFDSILYDIQDLAFRSYFGGRFDMQKRGYVGTAYLYDINSAYPYAISKIPDLSNGTWVQRKSIHKDAKMGFFHILANIPDEKYIAPFPFRTKNTIIFPTGKFETYVTLHELQACESSEFYKILDSYQFIPNSTTQPYKNFIESMYEKRLKLKKEKNPLQLPLKIILNSIYGKTGQVINNKMGNLFNPVIFSYITGFARAQLYSFIQKHGIEKEMVAFATDSICTTRKLNIGSTDLGDFSYEGESHDTFFLQNGFYRFQGKWKQRGLGNLGKDKIEHLKTFEKDDKLYYKFIIKRNSRLRSSILQNKISDIGKIRPHTKQVNLNADRKRLWTERLEGMSNDNFNDSMSLSFNHFTKDQI
jgi:hypothetical protein